MWTNFTVMDGLILLICSMTGVIFASFRPARIICFGFAPASVMASCPPIPLWLGPLIRTVQSWVSEISKRGNGNTNMFFQQLGLRSASGYQHLLRQHRIWPLRVRGRSVCTGFSSELDRRQCVEISKESRKERIQEGALTEVSWGLRTDSDEKISKGE
jgi:hypothetical protein